MWLMFTLIHHVICWRRCHIFANYKPDKHLNFVLVERKSCARVLEDGEIKAENSVPVLKQSDIILRQVVADIELVDYKAGQSRPSAFQLLLNRLRPPVVPLHGFDLDHQLVGNEGRDSAFAQKQILVKPLVDSLERTQQAGFNPAQFVAHPSHLVQQPKNTYILDFCYNAIMK